MIPPGAMLTAPRARAPDGTFRCSIALNVPLEFPTLRPPVDVVQRSSVEASRARQLGDQTAGNPMVATNPAGMDTAAPVHMSSRAARRARRARESRERPETVRTDADPRQPSPGVPSPATSGVLGAP